MHGTHPIAPAATPCTTISSPSRRARAFIIALLLGATALVNAAPVNVRTQPLSSVLIEKKYTAPATAVAINNSQISAEIAARISRINVQTGDIINAGETLATLDCRSYQHVLANARARYDSLKAQVQLSEQQLKRAKSLRKENNLSAENLDQRSADLSIAKANLKGQKASIDDAKLSLERCSITAPYRAAVVSRLVGEGTMATPGLPLLEIVGLDAVELSAQVPVDLVDSLSTSKSLVFVTRNADLPVTIRTLSPVINAASGNREVRLLTEQTLPPGTSGRLEWVSPPLLPANLLSQREETLGVLVAISSGDKHTTQFIPLDGALEGRPANIDLSGNLSADTHIIVEGRHKLAAGDEINIVTNTN